MKCNTA